MTFEIGQYLRNKVKINNVSFGKCKVCDERVAWARRELSSHKRSGNCLGQNDEEKLLFKNKYVLSEVSEDYTSSEAETKVRKGK